MEYTTQSMKETQGVPCTQRILEFQGRHRYMSTALRWFMNQLEENSLCIITSVLVYGRVLVSLRVDRINLGLWSEETLPTHGDFI